MTLENILSNTPPINLTGFMYSGKTAIWEALVRTKVFEVPPGKETRIGRYPGALMALYRTACSRQSMDEDSRLLSTAFFLGSLQLHNLPSGWISAHQPKEWEWCNSEILKSRSKYGLDYDKEFIKVIDYVNSSHDKSHEEILFFFQQSFRNIVRIISRVNSGRTVLFNNLYHSFDYETAKIYEPLSLIVVDRDIRDIFAETVTGGNISISNENYKNVVNSFVARQQKGRAALKVDIAGDFFSKGYFHVASERPIYYISFERFISNVSTRRAVYEFLKIPESDWSAADEQYDYSLSQKNIGRHSELSLPESALKYLVDSFIEKKIPFTTMID